MDILEFALYDHLRVLVLRTVFILGLFTALATGGCSEEYISGEFNSEVLGEEPSYSDRPISQVHNQDAIVTRLWVPGLNEGFIPQGITFADDQILVGVYQSTSAGISEGSTMVFRLDPYSGEVTGQFDLPSDVGHASGLAYSGDNILYVADSVGFGCNATGKILKVDLEKSLTEGNCDNSVIGELILDGMMTPCFLTFYRGYLWFGNYIEEESGSPEIYKIDPVEVFGEWPSINRISPDQILFSFGIDMMVQGAAFDMEGNLWLSRSNGSQGFIQEVDPLDGEVIEEYELMAGLEGLALSPWGELWSVSEAGTIKYILWETYYPLIFEIDITLLH